MRRIAVTDGLTQTQREMLRTVGDFVEARVLPEVAERDAADAFPDDLVAALADMGVFGLTIPEEYGGLGEPLLTYALVVEELARGWMSLSGIVNTHVIVAHMIAAAGTEEQRRALLPRMATGEVRAAFSMSEPGCGSDVAAITTRAVADGDTYVIDGQKMWVTNGGSAHLVAVLVRTADDPAARTRGLTAFLVDKPPGFGTVAPGLTVPGKLRKMGYKGVDTTELVFAGHRVGADAILGGVPGRGFAQMMNGVEVGRVNVAARACGVAMRALELAVDYARRRETFGRPIAEHQAVLFRLAEMATKVEAAHQLMVMAARRKDAEGRSDLAAGMAKYLGSEFCRDVVEDALRIHGGYGFSPEYEIERLYRDAPMLLIGEGTADIQKMIIGRRLLEGGGR